MTVLKQADILIAGAQPWNVNICSGNGQYFVFCSTLAVYIYEYDDDLKEYRLHSIMCENEKTITSVKWCKNNESAFVTTSSDNTVIVWDVCEQKIIQKIQNLDHKVITVEWYPYEKNIVSILLESGNVYLWKYLTSRALELLMDSSQGFIGKHCAMKWNAKVKYMLCFGNTDGSISLILPGKNVVKNILSTLDDRKNKATGKDNDDIVTDIQWDPLSTEYVLVSTEKGSLRLIDVEKKVVIMNYNIPKNEKNIRKFCWVDNAPGMFLTGDSNAGILRLWNVSSVSSILHFKIKETGFHSIHVVSSNSVSKKVESSESPFKVTSNTYTVPPVRAVSVFKDGGVGLYDLKKKKWDFLREKGHVETIFSCEFHPENPDLLATSSFDGTIKLWSIANMKMINESPGNLSIIYTIAWAPGDLNCIAAATSQNGLVIWNVGKNQITHRYKEHGDKFVFDCSWNKKDTRYLASTGADHCCVVRLIDGTLIKRFVHPANVYGCDWNPNNKDIIATGCQDSILRIWYLPSKKDVPLKVFKGHTAKVFDVKWSPIKDGVIATSSDDKTVRIWDYTEDGCLQCLEGHTSFVRRLQWNPEFADLLLSGSWDSNIKLWNVRTGYCIDTAEDHAADIYGLSCHPQRPFIFASSSRDSTLRLWNMDYIAQPLYMSLLSGQRIGNIIERSLNVQDSKDFTEVSKMSGAMMKMIKVKENEPMKDQLHFYSHIFLHPPGIRNIWMLVSILQRGDKVVLPDDYKEGIMHSSHLKQFQESKAKELETARAQFRKIMGPMKRKEELNKAATIYLSLGHLENYCEIMVELDQWERAISVSPGVSMEYWRSLIERYTKVLEEREDKELVTYCVATKNTEKICDFYMNRQQHKKAIISSKIALENNMGADEHCECKNNGLQDKKLSHMDKVRFERLHDECNIKLSEWYFQRGQACLSACCHLSLNDIQGAVWKLIRGNELELAFSLIKCFLSSIDEMLLKKACIQIARRCERYKLRDEAISVLKIIKNNSFELMLSCARMCSDDDQRNDYLQKAGFSSLEEYRKIESLGLIKDKNIDKLLYLLLTSCCEKMVVLTISSVKNCMKDENWNIDDVFRYTQILGCLPSTYIQKCDKKIRCEILALSAYIGALKAIQLKLYSIVIFLFQHASSLLKQEDTDIGITHSQLQDQSESWLVHRLQERSIKSEQFTQIPNKHQVKIYDDLMKKCVSNDKDNYTGEYVIAGQHLPSHCVTYVNHFTKQKIKGTAHVLEDGKSALPYNVALMWSIVNEFSPLGTGHKMNLF